jgi:hypothetical protein
VPGIHVLAPSSKKDVVAGTKPGHDEKRIIIQAVRKSPKMLDAFSVRFSE